MTLILYGLLISHITAYKEQYANIGITFAMAYIFKRLIKSFGAEDQSQLVGLGGYTLTLGEFVKLIKQMTVRGFEGKGIAGTEFKSGLIPDMFQTILESLKGDLTIHK